MFKGGEAMRSENEIVYGVFPVGDPKKEEVALASWNYIHRDLSDIKQRYIALGFHLEENRRYGYYENFGYIDFYEFCEKNFSLDKAAVSRCINVWKQFCLVQDGSSKMFLDSRYEKYSYSQLCEMLPLSDEQRREIKPDMTVKEIREKKRQWKEESGKAKKVQEEKVVTSQLEQRASGCDEKVVEEPDERVVLDVVLESLDSAWKAAVKQYEETPDEVMKRSINLLAKVIGEVKAQTKQSCGEKPIEKEEQAEWPEAELQSENIEQPELPVMKNMQEREAFINGYKNWKVWCRNEYTEEVFYRYDLPDGYAVVVRNYPFHLAWAKEEREGTELFLLKPGYRHFADCQANMTFIKKHLTDMQRKN